MIGTINRQKRPNLQFVGTKWISWQPKKTVSVSRNGSKGCGRSDFTKSSDITRCNWICSLYCFGGCGPTPKYSDPLLLFKSVIEENHWLQKSKKMKTLDRSSPTLSSKCLGEDVQTMAETESSEEMLPRAVLPTAPVMVDIVCQNDIKIEQYQKDVR
ncbi:hypothetical protein LSH36_2443g00003 [Paralvinella palmiformis]|uniref:Uncharacterized protein n=1 Tax=Paralvinella palmiformis TaxID=53620 RepID=A0AAD9IRL9_9ANNE|nr:hypothetical protein LSH36_2443g00003 [Paralvinella palmiformis]